VSGDGLGEVPRVGIEILDALTAAGFKTALGGGLALNLWVQPRTTKDVDLNVFVDEERYGALLAAVERLGCAASRDGAAWDDDRRAEFLRCARDGEVAVAWRGDVRLDLFVPSIPFYAEAERTLREVRFGGDEKLRLVLSPEALAVFKLLFFRERDILDLRRLVAARRATLDTAWVRGQMVDMLGEDEERVRTWDSIVQTHGSPPGH
jgi:Nucleotidyl transferase AbiEii toxin, Type IV TA system